MIEYATCCLKHLTDVVFFRNPYSKQEKISKFVIQISFTLCFLYSYFHGKMLTQKNPSLYCLEEGKKFFAASTMHLRTYLKNKAVGKSENPEG